MTPRGIVHWLLDEYCVLKSHNFSLFLRQFLKLIFLILGAYMENALVYIITGIHIVSTQLFKYFAITNFKIKDRYVPLSNYNN